MRSICLLSLAIINSQQNAQSLVIKPNADPEENIALNNVTEDADVAWLYKDLCHAAYFEEGRTSGDCNNNVLYPRTWYEQAMRLDHKKIYNFNFIGKLNRNKAFLEEDGKDDKGNKKKDQSKIEKKNRRWVPRFVGSHFGENDYYRNTYPEKKYKPLGAFDHSLEHIPFLENKRKNMDSNHQVPFDSHYFQVLANSNFTLCPAGDKAGGFTSRFFETIMAKSICIMESASHAGGLESREKSAQVGWHFYVLDDIEKNPAKLIYNEEWVEENLRNFRKLNTLMGDKFSEK